MLVVWRRGELAAHRRQRLLALDGVCHLELSDLGADDAEALVRGRLPAADPAFVSACAHVCGGNPFLLHELVSTGQDRGPDRRRLQLEDPLGGGIVVRDLAVDHRVSAAPAAARASSSDSRAT